MAQFGHTLCYFHPLLIHNRLYLLLFLLLLIPKFDILLFGTLEFLIEVTMLS